jgi:hypothetical protein
MKKTTTFAQATPVDVAVIWPHDMSGMWVAGFAVVRDDGGRLIDVRGPDGRERKAERDRVRLPEPLDEESSEDRAAAKFLADVFPADSKRGS